MILARTPFAIAWSPTLGASEGSGPPLIVVVVVVAALAGLAGWAVAGRSAGSRRGRGDGQGGGEGSVDHHAVAQAVHAALADQRAALATTVAQVAGEQLRTQQQAGSHELGLRSAAIEQQVAAMGHALQQVGGLVQRLQVDRHAQHAELVARMDESLRATSHLADTTRSLREALASPKARGQWGERMAEDVLRVAGFAEGINYRRQRGLPGGTIPDITFLLPRGIELHMDVKFPVDNYLRHLDAPDEASRAATAKAFLGDVRRRVKELSGRGYTDPTGTPGYVLLFIPNEAVYSFVHQHDPALADQALSADVVLCSPFTLFAVLGVIRQAAEAHLLERAGDEILQALGAFGAEWTKFTDHLDRLGKQLDTVGRTYGEITGPRLRQVERNLRAIDRLREERGLGSEVTASTSRAEQPDAVEAQPDPGQGDGFTGLKGLRDDPLPSGSPAAASPPRR